MLTEKRKLTIVGSAPTSYFTIKAIDGSNVVARSGFLAPCIVGATPTVALHLIHNLYNFFLHYQLFKPQNTPKSSPNPFL